MARLTSRPLLRPRCRARSRRHTRRSAHGKVVARVLGARRHHARVLGDGRRGREDLGQSSRVGLRFTVRPRPLPACFPSCSGNHLIQVVLVRMGYAGAQHEFTIMEDDDDDSRLPSAATCFVRVTLSRFVARVCLLLIRCHHAPRTRSACPITAANRRCRRDF